MDGLIYPLGVEKEVWLTDPNGRLRQVHWTYFQDFSTPSVSPRDLIVVHQGRAESQDKILPELPVHQIELVTAIAADVEELRASLDRLDTRVQRQARKLNLWPLSTPMPPVEITEEMVEVFPKPRYQRHKERIPAHTLKHAWIAGTHIHLGVRSWEEAITTFNHMQVFMPVLMAVSVRDDRRFAEYRSLMTKLEQKIFPPLLSSYEQFEMLAEAQGFADDPGSCWWLMRLNPQGTVELRFFDAQENSEHVVQLAALVRALASYADIKGVRLRGPAVMEKDFIHAAYDPGCFMNEVQSWVQKAAMHAHDVNMLPEFNAIVALMRRKGLNLGRVSQLVS